MLSMINLAKLGACGLFLSHLNFFIFLCHSLFSGIVLPVSQCGLFRIYNMSTLPHQMVQFQLLKSLRASKPQAS
jgi:hypothetical protein